MLFPRRLHPANHKIPGYAIATRCPLCRQPIIFVWQPRDDGSWRAVAVDPFGWRGETVFLPRLVRHSKFCDLQTYRPDVVKETHEAQPG